MTAFNPANYEGRDRIAHIEDYLQNRVDTTMRPNIALRQQGLLSEVFPRANTTGSAALVSGTVYYGLLGLRQGDVVNNVNFVLTANNTSASLVRSGLYDPSTSALLASSADSSAMTTSGAIKGVSMSLTNSYTAPADSCVYAALLTVVGTPGSFTRGSNSDNGVAIGSGNRPFGAQTAQTELPATATIVTSVLNPWLSVS